MSINDYKRQEDSFDSRNSTETQNQLARKKALDRLESALKITGLSASALADQMGLSKSTFTRFMRGKEKHVLSHKTLTALNQFVERHLESAGAFDLLDAWVRSQVHGESSDKNAFPINVVAVEVHGHVEAGAWKEVQNSDHEEREIIYFPNIKSSKPVFALIVSGDSMNLVYPEGTYLICTPMYSYNRQLENGDHVIVQQSRNGLYEATVKEFQIDAFGKASLHPKSTNPMFQKSIPLPSPLQSENNDGLLIQIAAVVIGDYNLKKDF